MMKMITEKDAQTYYQALLDRNPEFEGTFFVGVKTTGIFCRPTCPARKPKFENCEFFKTAQQALIASFRPCNRCKPLSAPGHASELIQKLVDAVENNPEKRWKDQDFKDLSVSSETARRQFKQRFGMTFVEYARARRMGLAFKQIRQGVPIINTQLDVGYESGSGFRDAFSKIMGCAPAKANTPSVILKADWIDTPLGPMCAIGDDDGLHLLEFSDRRGLEREIERLRLRKKAAIIPGQTKPIQAIKEELAAYFLGTLKTFKTPIHLMGSDFQKRVWQALLEIPYGQTRSYLQQAMVVGNDKACRAVANANGANQLAIIIPCHRIINSNGELGGYGGGVMRKKWLIEHEKMQSEDYIKSI